MERGSQERKENTLLMKGTVLATVDYDNLTTDEIFDMLPTMVRHHNNEYIGEYFLKLFKGLKGIIIEYDDGQHNLGQTYRRGKNLRDAVIQMHEWLVKFGYNG